MNHYQAQAKTASEIDPFTLTWQAEVDSMDYHPVYLGNTRFGGLLGYSGCDMTIQHAAVYGPSDAIPAGVHPVAFPVSVANLRFFYQTQAMAPSERWMGCKGMQQNDSQYRPIEEIPLIPQVYDIKQILHLDQGILSSEATLFEGSLPAWRRLHAEAQPCGIRFKTATAFLKDHDQAGFSLTMPDDGQIKVVLDPIVFEQFGLHLGGKGLMTLGTAVNSDLSFKKDDLEFLNQPGVIGFAFSSRYGTKVKVGLASATGSWGSEQGLQNLSVRAKANQSVFFVLLVSVDANESLYELAQRASLCAAQGEQTFFAKQSAIWKDFWQQSSVVLPADQAFKQQVYLASLYYVAQSTGSEGTLPTGLSKPMYPYWTGNYHDTDTYFARALLESNHAAQAARHLDYRHACLEVSKKMAALQGRPGAFYPFTADLVGWGEAKDIPTSSAIIAVESWFHYAYSGSIEALKKSWQIMTGIAEQIFSYIDWKGSMPSTGVIPTFSETIDSPNPSEFWIGALALSRCLVKASEVLGQGGDSALLAQCRQILSQVSIPRDDKRYLFADAVDAPILRCPSVSLALFPYALEAHNDQFMRQSYYDEVDKLITIFAWMPYQFAVCASMLGIKEGDYSACGMLEQAEIFLKPWHAFDEWENRRMARAGYFITAAGGYCLSINHMLVDAPQHDCIRLFAGVPWMWSDLSFEKLVTNNGYRVSAWRKNGLTHGFVLEALAVESQTPLRLELDRVSPKLLSRIKQAGLNFIYQTGTNGATNADNQVIVLSTEPGKNLTFLPA